MEHPDSAVMSFIIGHAPGLLRRLYLLEQKGMIAFFDSKDIVEIVVLQRLDVRRIRTQAVFGDDALEVRVVLAQFDDNRLVALRSQSFLSVPSSCPIGSGLSGITARTSGWMIAAPNI